MAGSAVAPIPRDVQRFDSHEAVRDLLDAERLSPRWCGGSLDGAGPTHCRPPKISPFEDLF
jgi:hypothetical protein